jgi:hypothetical protein
VSEEKLIRLEHFKALIAARGWQVKDLPVKMGWGRYSFWNDLIEGNKSFGEKLARRIEAKLELHRYQLDEAPDKMPEGYVRLDAHERAMIESYRAISKEARQLDFELDQFGEQRAEVYQALLVRVEELRAKLLTAPAPSPSAPSAAKPKTRPVRTR